MLADAIAAHPDTTVEVLTQIPWESLSSAGKLDVAARTNNQHLLRQVTGLTFDGTYPLSNPHLTGEGRRILIDYGDTGIVADAVTDADAGMLREIIAARGRYRDGRLRYPYLRRLLQNPNAPADLVREGLQQLVTQEHSTADILDAVDLHHANGARLPHSENINPVHADAFRNYVDAGSLAEYVRRNPQLTPTDCFEAVSAAHDPDVYWAVIKQHPCAVEHVLSAALDNARLPRDVHHHALRRMFTRTDTIHPAAVYRWAHLMEGAPDDLLALVLDRGPSLDFLPALADVNLPARQLERVVDTLSRSAWLREHRNPYAFALTSIAGRSTTSDSLRTRCLAATRNLLDAGVAPWEHRLLVSLCDTVERTAGNGVPDARFLPVEALPDETDYEAAPQVRALLDATVNAQPALRRNCDLVRVVLRLAHGFRGTIGELIDTAAGITGNA